MKQLDPRAVWYFSFHFILRNLIPLLIIVFFLVPTFFIKTEGMMVSRLTIVLAIFRWTWIIIPVVVVLGYVWARLTYYYYRYELTDAGFRKEHGVIYKKYVTIPYDRIQNVDIYRGILARLLGLSTLHIQTAGMSVGAGGSGRMAEGQLPALSKEVAEQLRDELIQRTRRTTSQGL